MTRKLLTHAFWVIMGCYWVSVVVTDVGPYPAFVASPSNPQAVSTEGFNPGYGR